MNDRDILYVTAVLDKEIMQLMLLQCREKIKVRHLPADTAETPHSHQTMKDEAEVHLLDVDCLVEGLLDNRKTKLPRRLPGKRRGRTQTVFQQLCCITEKLIQV